MTTEVLALPSTLIIASAMLGLIVGSFLNVVIHRLPTMLERDWRAQCDSLIQADARAQSALEPAAKTPATSAQTSAQTCPAPMVEVSVAPYNLMVPRSQCPACHHPIGAIENIPIVSWLALRGRCSACKTPISARYPLVEALTAVLFGLAAWRFGASAAGLGALCLIGALVALTFIDIDTQLLPDAITLPLLWAGLVFNLGGTFIDLHSAVIGAALGYLSLWSIYWLFRFATGKEGMGFGDFKLLAALGAWLGWKMLPFIVLASSVVGAVVGIVLIVLARHGREVPIPFGPYLASAGAVALFAGEALIDRYLMLFH